MQELTNYPSDSCDECGRRGKVVNKSEEYNRSANEQTEDKDDV
jgi:hypothetical protein